MSDQYRLAELGNSELLAGLSKLAQQSNALTGQLLAHLVELEERKLHLELGFSSLFAYCVEALRMSEGSAGRRITAARVCGRFPQVFGRIARGDLHLCALCALAQYLSPENATELFEACKGKTRRQVEELLAARFPRPDVREQIRRLPARAPELVTPVERTSPPTRAVGNEASPSVAPEILTTEQIPVPVPAAGSVQERRRTRELEPLSVDRFGVHFTADAELRELIERARALASHQLPNGDLASLIKLMAASFVRQEEKRRFGIGANARRIEGTAKTKSKPARSPEQGASPGGVPASPAASGRSVREADAVETGKHGRYLTLAVRREAHRRDLGQCAFVAVDGRRCTARAFLEFDHIEPYAKSGASDILNVRLLCKAHNLLHARHCFGSTHIAAKIAARKRHVPVKQSRM